MAKLALALEAKPADKPAVAFVAPKAKASEPTFNYVYKYGDGFRARLKVNGRTVVGRIVDTREEAAAEAMILGDAYQGLGGRMKKPLPSGLSFEVEDDVRDALVDKVRAACESEPAVVAPPASGHNYVAKKGDGFRARLTIGCRTVVGRTVDTREEAAAEAKIIGEAYQGFGGCMLKPLPSGLSVVVDDDVRDWLVAKVRAAYEGKPFPKLPRVEKPAVAASDDEDDEEVVESEEDEEDVDDDYSVHDSSEDEREEVPPEPVEPELSEYELQIKARIARNEAYMRSLGLGGGLVAAAKKLAAPKRKPRGPPREGSRKSPRLA